MEHASQAITLTMACASRMTAGRFESCAENSFQTPNRSPAP